MHSFASSQRLRGGVRRWLTGAAMCALVGLCALPGARRPAEAAPAASPAVAAAGVDDAASCARAFPSRGGKALPNAEQGSTVALSSWGKQLVAYVAHEDDRAIHVVDVDAGKEVAATPLAGTPSSVLVLGDGRLAVTLRETNKLEIYEPGARPADPLVKRCSLSVASEPVSMAKSSDGATLAVTSGWGRKLVAYDVASMTPRAEVELAREPRAIVMTDDGERAFVAHVVDGKMSVVDLPTASSSSSSVRTIDLKVQKQGAAQMGCQGFALAKAVTLPASGGKTTPPATEQPLPKGAAPPPSPKAATPPSAAAKPEATPPAPVEPAKPAPLEGRIFAPMVTVDPGDQGSSSSGYGSPERGPTERPIVSVVDAGAERAVTRAAAGDLLVSRAACLLPRAAAFDASTSSLLVACLGSDAILRLDARAVDPSRRETGRFQVPSGPTGLALDPEGRRAVVFSQFASKLSILAFDGQPQKTIDVPVLAARMPAGNVLRGRTLFHATNDVRISGDGRACASCHPDGREDAITWQTPDGPRQTMMLAGRLGATAPFGWDGDKQTVDEHVADTLVRLRGVGMTDVKSRADFDALVAYVKSMRAPVPVAVSASRASLVQRGEEIFLDKDAACVTCHAGGGTNGQAFSVGGDATKFDTPSLRGISGTAPYFHDGRFETLDALLASPDHSMGKTLQLTRKDRIALAAYLETL